MGSYLRFGYRQQGLPNSFLANSSSGNLNYENLHIVSDMQELGILTLSFSSLSVNIPCTIEHDVSMSIPWRNGC